MLLQVQLAYVDNVGAAHRAVPEAIPGLATGSDGLKNVKQDILHLGDRITDTLVPGHAQTCAHIHLCCLVSVCFRTATCLHTCLADCSRVYTDGSSQCPLLNLKENRRGNAAGQMARKLKGCWFDVEEPKEVAARLGLEWDEVKNRKPSYWAERALKVVPAPDQVPPADFCAALATVVSINPRAQSCLRPVLLQAEVCG